MAGIKKDMTGHGNESLPQAWKDILQRNFTTFRDHLRAQDIVPHLFSALVLSSHQLDEINAIPTEYGKTEYLMNKVLRRSSRDKLAKFKQALSDSGQSHLIKYLPSDLPFNYDDGVSTAAQREETDSQQPLTQATTREMDTEPIYEVIPDRPMHPVQSTQSIYVENIAQKYPRKPSHTGLCVIFGFFVTDDFKNHSLPGYKTDIGKLTNLFQNQLDYKVVSYKNLSKAKFLAQLESTQQTLNSDKHDRFVLIVLSHGCQNGVFTCAEENGYNIENELGSSSPSVVSYRSIRDFFTHDNVQCMKGLPKFLMFQCCRGNSQVVTAAPSTQETVYDPECDPHTFGIDADFLISYATESSYESAVHHAYGSWFVQDFLKALEGMDPSVYEVEKILRHTNYLVSHRADTDNQHKVLRQTSVYHSSLRKEFFLKDDRD